MTDADLISESLPLTGTEKYMASTLLSCPIASQLGDQYIKKNVTMENISIIHSSRLKCKRIDSIDAYDRNIGNSDIDRDRCLSWLYGYIQGYLNGMVNGVVLLYDFCSDESILMSKDMRSGYICISGSVFWTIRGGARIVNQIDFARSWSPCLRELFLFSRLPTKSRNASTSTFGKEDACFVAEQLRSAVYDVFDGAGLIVWRNGI